MSGRVIVVTGGSAGVGRGIPSWGDSGRFADAPLGYAGTHDARSRFVLWVMLEIQPENDERRYAKIRPQIPVPNPEALGVVQLQIELWGGADDGDLQIVQVHDYSAQEILASLERG